MYSSVSAGKELYHKTCGTPRSSHSSRTWERGAAATTTEAKVILIRLQKLAERVYAESQCGFGAGRSTIDTWSSPFASSRRITENNRCPCISLSLTSTHKGVYLVSRDGLFQTLPKTGCPPELQSMIESFHTKMKGTVHFNGSFTRPFDIRSGVKQG